MACERKFPMSRSIGRRKSLGWSNFSMYWRIIERIVAWHSTGLRFDGSIYAQTVLPTFFNSLKGADSKIVSGGFAPRPLFLSLLDIFRLFSQYILPSNTYIHGTIYTLTFEKYFTTSKYYVMVDDQPGTLLCKLHANCISKSKTTGNQNTANEKSTIWRFEKLNFVVKNFY